MSKKNQPKAYKFSTLFDIFALVKPYKKWLVAAIACTLLTSVSDPLRPYIVQRAVDDFTQNPSGSSTLEVAVILLLLSLFQSLFYYFQTYSTNVLGQNIIFDLRAKLFSHIVQLNNHFFSHNPVGRLITRVVSDIESISNIFAEGILMIIGDLLKIIFILAVMIYASPKLTLFVMLPMLLLFVATYLFKEAIKKAYHEVRIKVAELNTFLQEKISGMLVIQAFAVEKKETQKFKEINAQHRNAHIKSIWAYSIFYPVVEIIMALSTGVLVYWGLKDVLTDDISFGVVVSFIMYINLIYRPIREMADKFNSLQMGLVAGTRVFEILKNKDSIEDKGVIENIDIQSNIIFDKVSFSYKPEKQILKQVSFEVKQGDTLAIVGATGAGKSTIIQLINRFYDIKEGEIKIGGNNIKDYKLDFLRRLIGIILQDAFMFSDTIHQNITLGDSEVEKQKILEAVKILGAEKFISKLKGDLDFNIMERGSSLSAGYLQILSLLRAFIYKPKILILDEATSSVDTESEIVIQRAIHQLMSHCTSIVIAHRLSTILHAKEIIVLDQGEIKERGSHKELLNSKEGYYTKLYEAQFKHHTVYE